MDIRHVTVSPSFGPTSPPKLGRYRLGFGLLDALVDVDSLSNADHAALVSAVADGTVTVFPAAPIATR